MAYDPNNPYNDNPDQRSDPNSPAGTPPPSQPGVVGPSGFKSVAGAPSATDIGNWYQKYTNRAGTNDEVLGWLSGKYSGNDPSTWESQIANSGEAQAYKNKQNGTTAGGGLGWVNDALTGVQSTDDPSYWMAKIQADPKAMSGDPSAIAYWQDRIKRGNGSALVKNGTLSLFNDGPGNGGAAGTGASGGGSSSLNTSGASPNMQALIDQLTQRAGQSLNIDPNDPIIKNQVNAANANLTRGSRTYLQGLAEKNGPNTNLNSETRLANEQVGQQTATLQSQLMSNELNSRRTEIQNALSEEGALRTSEQQLALQKELGYLNDALSRYSIGTNAGLQQQQINSNNDQFLQKFGLESSNNKSYWDWLRSTGSAPPGAPQ